MRRSVILTLVAAAAFFSAAALYAADATPGPQPQIPRKAPELTIQMPGKQMLLSQFHGYICALAVMSTTCPHCQHLAQVLSGLQQEYAPKGVQMLGVVVNAEANVELPNFRAVFARNMFPIGMSTDPITREFLQHPPGISYFPMMVFIDKQGVIRAEHLGATDGPFFEEKTEVQNIRGELDNIIKQPTIQLSAPKKK